MRMLVGATCLWSDCLPVKKCWGHQQCEGRGLARRDNQRYHLKHVSSAHGSLMSTESLPESRELTDTKSGDYDGQSALHSGITVRSIGLSH